MTIDATLSEFVQRVEEIDQAWSRVTVHGEHGPRTITVRRRSMFPERPRPSARTVPPRD